MYYHRSLIAVTIVILNLVMFISVAQAQQPIDFTDCSSGTFTLLSDAKEFTVLLST